MIFPALIIPLALAYLVDVMEKRTRGTGSGRAFSIAGWATLALGALSLRSAWNCDDWERFGETLVGGAVATIACFVLASSRTQDKPGASTGADWRPKRVNRFFRRERETNGDGPLAGWGTSTQYAEVAHDGFIVRLVQVFEGGRAIKYDEAHEADGYGGLGDTAVDLEEEGWLRSEITSVEFERAWDGAQATNR